MANQPNRKTTLRFRPQDEWILKEIRNIVTTKEAMGYDTSESFEVARLLRLSIIGDMDNFLERQNRIKARTAPMQLDRNLQQLFKEFLLSKFGVEPEEVTYKGELSRFMLLTVKLLIVREVSKDSENVEVWMSDKPLLNKIEEEFWAVVASTLGAPDDGE